MITIRERRVSADRSFDKKSGKPLKAGTFVTTYAVIQDRKIIDSFYSREKAVTSAFQFGRGYGMIEGIVAALGWPIEYVTPQKWKKALGVPADKDDARARACQMMPQDSHLWTPQRGVFDKQQASGRADAALICLFGARSLGVAK